MNIGKTVKDVLWDSPCISRPVYDSVSNSVNPSVWNSKWNQIWEPVIDLVRISRNIRV